MAMTGRMRLAPSLEFAQRKVALHLEQPKAR